MAHRRRNGYLTRKQQFQINAMAFGIWYLIAQTVIVIPLCGGYLLWVLTRGNKPNSPHVGLSSFKGQA